MRSGWLGLAGFVTLVALALPATASPGTIGGTTALPLQVSGTHAADAGDAQYLLSGSAGQASMLLQGDGKLTVVTQRAFGVVDSGDHARFLWQQRVDTQTLDLHGAVLTLLEREPRFTAYLYDGAATLSSGAQGGPLAVGLQGDPVRVSEDLQPPLSVQLVSQERPFERTIPAGLLAANAMDGHLAADGAFHMYLSEARLGYYGADGALRTIEARFHTESRPGTVYDPLTDTWVGGGSHPEYVAEYLLVQADAAHLDLQAAGVPATLYSNAPAITVDGQATLPKLHGTVTVQDKDGPVTHAVDGQDLQLTGHYTLRLAPDGTGSARVAGEGEFTTVTYGAVTAHYDWTPAAVAVGLGALLVGGLAWAVANGKAVLGTLGGGLLTGYARVHGDEVLEHPGRAEVYERVKAFPGVNFVQLSQQVGFGASTLNYHLRVLERNGYVTSVRDGRYLRFFDRASGAYAGARKLAVSALRNETTAAMAKHIRDNPGVAQCDLAARFQVTASTVTWHINRLASQGLVQKERKAQHTRYYLGEGWSQLPFDEQSRQASVEAPARPAEAPAVPV